MERWRGLMCVVPLVVIGTALTSGCDLIPGTSANVERRAKDLAAEQLIDPASAQFRNVEVRDGAVCGEINGKNRMGAYVGFTRFVVEISSWEAALDPDFDPTSLESAQSLCRSIDGSSCSEATELEGKQMAQLAFTAKWDSKCSGSGAAAGQGARMPWDPTAYNQATPGENWVEDRTIANASGSAANVASRRASGDDALMGSDFTNAADVDATANDPIAGAGDASNSADTNSLDEGD